MKNNFFSTIPKDNPSLIIGASIGNCVHIAGIAGFLRIAESMGFKTILLGPALSPMKIIEAIDKFQPQAVGISYRLTPEAGTKIIDEFLKLLGERNPILLFGGIEKTAIIAKNTGRFSYIFTGDEPFSQIGNVLKFIQGVDPAKKNGTSIKEHKPTNIIDRLYNLIRVDNDGHYFPLLRHHFGLPALTDTIKGIKEIADAEIIDILSIAPDQNAQQYFFHPDRMDTRMDGAGGVPIRNKKDLKDMKNAAQRGNFPLLRIYSGTQDLEKWAKTSVEEMDNAWGAIPLFWYSELDGRSGRSLKHAIKENQTVIRWYANKGLPIEILEAHQWSLRDAPDAVSLSAAYIGAWNARAFGVKDFISQYMFNTPRFTSPISDLSKMTAQYLLIESLCSDSFVQWRQVRPGLSHFSGDPSIAKGQLASAVTYALGLRPHIIHVVSYTEANHAANSQEVIESCKIVLGALKNALPEVPDPLKDPRIAKKRAMLIEETSWILGTIHNLGKQLGAEDPFTDTETLSMAVKIGILDAPHFKGSSCAMGCVETGPVDGGCHTIDISKGCFLEEKDRLTALMKSSNARKIIGSDSGRIIRKWNFSNQIKGSAHKMIEWPW